MSYPRTKLGPFLFFVIYLLLPTGVSAQLSDSVRIFYKCYSHLVHRLPSENHPLLIRVKDQTLSGVDACMQILNLGRMTIDPDSGEGFVEKVLQPGGRDLDLTKVNAQSEALLVFKTMNDLHREFFDIHLFDIMYGTGSYELYDINEPAYHVTRAMFHPQGQYRDIVTRPQTLKAIRHSSADRLSYSLMPQVPGGSRPKIHRMVTWKFEEWLFPRTESGILVGIEDEPVFMVRGNYNGPKQDSNGNWIMPAPYPANQNFGGGVLGSPSYLQTRTAGVQNYGLLDVSRTFGLSIFKDLLCRELPVVRRSDVQAMDNSEVEFKKGHTCIQCHTSMDRVSWVIRRISKTYTSYDNSFNDALHTSPLYGQECRIPDSNEACWRGHGARVTLHAGEQVRGRNNPILYWPEPHPNPTTSYGSDDINFARRPADGAFHYRTIDGVLHDSLIRAVPDNAMTGLQPLGEYIAGLDDYYHCAASRYVKFFTGFDMKLADFADPANPPLTEAEAEMLAFIKQLGTQLKAEQDTKRLIKRIFESPYYLQE